MSGKSCPFFVFLVLFLGCGRPALNPVPFQNFSENKVPFPGCYVWKKVGLEGESNFRYFLFDSKGSWKLTNAVGIKPHRTLNQIGKRVFPPDQNQIPNDLDQGQTVLSPDRRYAVWTYSIKTFADDLDNTYLMLRDSRDSRVERIMVPALSNGEMISLFWHPQVPLFYFMVSVGDEKSRSLELWEYDLLRKKFENIGDTNGDATISKDGRWILWETGPFQTKAIKLVGNSVLLCAYNTEEKINYPLNENPSMSMFQSWEN